MQRHRPLAGFFALLSIVLGAGAFVYVMLDVGGLWPFLAFPASAIAAYVGFLFLGAPRTRRDLERARAGSAVTPAV
jgi:hypothetical protein